MRIQTMRTFAGIIFTVLLSFQLSAQKLDRVQGELLIVLEDGVDMQDLLPDLGTFENKRTKAISDKLNTSPMALWKLDFDYTETHEIRFLDEVRSMRGVKMAQFNHLIEFRNIPDDPEFPKQWQYINDGVNGQVEDADIDMDLAWDITTGGLTFNGDTIVACVIDGGMDPTHEDFGDNLWKNWAEIPDNDIDDDNNGYVDDYSGWSAYDDNDNVFIGGSHGTPVAGIIGAQGNNGIGVSGVNWDVKVMIVRGGGNEAAALEAYAYPYTLRKRYNETKGEEGAFVVVTNASWGTDLLHWEDAPIWCSFYDSLGVQGILNCGATANANYNIDEDGDMPTSCPSDYLISVTNMASDDKKVSGAGYGVETIDLGAFGAGTWTTALNNSYSGFGGTSGATPHVSGSVALAYSVSCDILADLAMENPGQAAMLIKEFILKGVKPNESLEGKTLTGGKLNVNNSLLLLENFCGDCPFPVSVDVEDITAESASLSWSVPVDSMFFDVVFRETGEEEWDTLYEVQSPLYFDDLTSCTQYEYKIKTRCIEDQGSYSFVYDFETDGCCTLPPGHSVEWQADSLLITLEDILATDTYTLEYKRFGSVDWQSVTQDSPVFTLPLPGDCMIYQFRYRSVCEGQDIEFSELFQTETNCEDCVENQLCETSGNNYFEYIDTLQIASFVNASGRDENAYGNYTFALAAELEAGENYSFRMVPGFNDNAFDEYVKFYGDFNQNGSFESNELIIDTFIEDGNVMVEDFMLPEYLIAGYAKFRLILSFQKINDPCATVTYGEIEDYCFYLNGMPSECMQGEFTIDTTDLGLYSASLIWNDPEGLVDFIYRYRLEGEVDWNTGTTSDTTIYLNELDSCAVYEFELQANCVDGMSEFSETFTFKTDCINAVDDENLGDQGPSIYPNPFADVLYIQLPASMQGKQTLRFYTMNGRELFSLGNDRNDTNGVIQIEEFRRLGLNAGVYFLKIENEESSHVAKVTYLP